MIGHKFTRNIRLVISPFKHSNDLIDWNENVKLNGSFHHAKIPSSLKKKKKKQEEEEEKDKRINNK